MTPELSIVNLINCVMLTSKNMSLLNKLVSTDLHRYQVVILVIQDNFNPVK